LSASHYSRLFVNRTGHSPIGYFIQLKIQRVCPLFGNSGWMIAGVACEMDFEDEFNFSGVFMKVMGLSPAECRKRWVENSGSFILKKPIIKQSLQTGVYEVTIRIRIRI